MKKKWNDLQVEIWVGNLLRFGVMAAASFAIAGGVFYLTRHGVNQIPDYCVFRGEPQALCHVNGVVHQALGLSGRGLIQIGFLVLIATPVSRVVLSAFAFWRQGDILYVCITLTVLALLLFSLFGGRL